MILIKRESSSKEPITIIKKKNQERGSKRG